MSHCNSDFQVVHTVPLVSQPAAGTSPSRTPGDRIRLRDWRDLYLLIGECRNVGADGLIWRRHLIERMQDFLDADMVSFLDCDVRRGTELLCDRLQPTSTLSYGDLGSSTDTSLELLLGVVSQLRVFQQDDQSSSCVRVTSRNDLATALGTSYSGFAHSLEASIAVGDFVFSMHRQSHDRIQLLALFRRHNRPYFERRVPHLIRTLWLELSHFQPTELKGLESSVFHIYPKRMLQVVACLLTGSTAKETAKILGISVHTVQEHIKRLYKRTSTSNRAELAEFFRDAAPQLIGTPLDQFPDCR